MSMWNEVSEKGANEITREYETEVRSLAEEVRQRVKDGEEASDVIHEVCDGHQWVIYTYSNWLVCMASRTDPFDVLADMGQESGITPALLAYACLSRDVEEEFARIEDSEEEASDETP